jgi:hypothetical protein
MTTRDSDHSSTAIRPPLWAEAVIPLLLPPIEAETVCGDLIEEYRETVYLTRGKWRADLWFVRQVSSFAWRGLMWGALLALAFLLHPTVIAGIWQPGGWPPRPGWQPNGIVLELAGIAITVFLLAARSAWRIGYVRSGILAALSVGAAGGVVFLVGSGLEIAFRSGVGSVFHSVRQLAIQVTVVALSLAALFGTSGALAGKVLRIANPPRSAV